MELLEFLFQNFYVVIGAVFFLYKFLKKPEKQNKQSDMPSFEGEESGQLDPNRTLEKHGTGSSPKLDGSGLSEQLDPSQSQHNNQTVYRSRLDSEISIEGTSHEMKELDGINSDYRRGMHDRNRDSVPERSSRPSFASLGGQSFPQGRESIETSRTSKPRLSKAELRQAFIWSEVLGSPRAKRSYRK
ncbi:hypothetical protein [Paenibacillus sp. L3-i20]|uniref:hypothetical protein n=1 Tax=Paenibacillus sp. L3-i20 TaxID=2905833 RepID=UPI001EE04520|nr:hypothetical protein [Paenibacillus sp. L3-i20]GKU79717.1 hypothetical protein L3i20_v241140 [Paenibacillus sp. L3-i20]